MLCIFSIYICKSCGFDVKTESFKCNFFSPIDWLKTSATWALKWEIIIIGLRRTVPQWNIRLNQVIDNNNLVTIQELIIETRASRDNSAIKKTQSRVNQLRYGSWLMALYCRKLHFLLLMKSKELPPPDNFAPPPWALTLHKQSRLYVFFLLASYLSPRPNDSCVFLPPSQLATERRSPPLTSPSRENQQLAGGTGAGQRQVSFFSYFWDPNGTTGGWNRGQNGEVVLRHDKTRQKQHFFGPNKVAGRVNYQFRAVDWHYKWNGVNSACQKPTHFTPGRVSFLAKPRVNQTPGSLSTCSNLVLHRSIMVVFLKLF